MVRISKKRLERKLDLDYGNEDWMYTAHFFPRDSVPFDIVEPIKKKMVQTEGDTTNFNKHRNIWICGYQSHKTKKRIRLIRFILDSSHMEDMKGRDDDSSESSYSAISHVSNPFNQEASSGLKELVRGARAGVYTNGSTGRPWAWVWHGQVWVVHHWPYHAHKAIPPRGKVGVYAISPVAHFALFARPRPGNYHNDQTMTTTTTITTRSELR